MINHSYLLGLYGLSGGGSMGYAPPVASPTRKTQPTAPWSAGSERIEASALVRGALAGRRIINEAAAQVDLKGASPDYRRMFALYQGLDTLAALADRAGERGVGASEQAMLAKRFAAGLEEVSAWLTKAEFEDVRLVQGLSAASAKTTAGVAGGAVTYITGAVHQGSVGEAVAAFEGDVRFDVRVRTSSGEKVVAIDLSAMDGTSRTLDAVVGHINDRLSEAGVQTRFAREKIVAEPRTVKVGDRVVSLPPRPDEWALAVRGTSTETVSFSAPQTSDAVYVVQASGTAGGRQVLKFQSDGGQAAEPRSLPSDPYGVEGRIGVADLPDGVEAVRASAAAADGGLWLVADLKEGPSHQPIKGERDVALIKLDSAGRVVMTRALGAASTASGYAIAVDPEGRVAVAGSVTGSLGAGRPGDVVNVADSFVTVFDALGQEVWTQRRGARAEDEATAVTFGDDGVVYVAGRAKSAMPGGASSGGWDGYVQAFEERQAYSSAPTVGTPLGLQQFGSAGDDAVSAIAAANGSLYSAGVENGRLVVRRFTVGSAGQPVLAATRDLGSAAGEVSGVAVVDGRVVVTGATRNAGLEVGGATSAHHGGQDAFVAVLDGSLSASPEERLTYIGGEGDDSAADVKIQDGKLWITGVANRALGARGDAPTQAYLSRVDIATGAVEWRREWRGEAQQASPLALAVVAGGASVLDRLGLPSGEIGPPQSKDLVTATSLRAGDRFYVSPSEGGRAVAVNIDARDTLQTLARKIEQASKGRLKVTVLSESAASGGGEAGLRSSLQRLSIVAKDGSRGAVLTPGEAGRDALAGLGLSAGYIGKTTGDDVIRTFGLNLSGKLRLGDPESAKAASDGLVAALTAVREAYRSLAPAQASAKPTGPAPAYLTAQLANYQAALARLTGG